MMRASVAIASLLAGGLISSVNVQPAYAQQHFEVFGGGDVTGHSWFGYVGGVVAPMSDINESGVLLRGLFGYGEYEYGTRFPGAVGGIPTTVDGEITTGEIMGGYQLAGPNTVLKVFAGVQFQDHDLSPNDVRNPVRGGETGAKFQGEIYQNLSESVWASAIGTYSTSFDTYWTRGRLGFEVAPDWSIGPEAGIFGNDRFDQWRVGGFARRQFGSNALTLNAGFADDRNEGDSAYGGATYSLRF